VVLLWMAEVPPMKGPAKADGAARTASEAMAYTAERRLSLKPGPEGRSAGGKQYLDSVFVGDLEVACSSDHN
jgi:hypothetical protein